MNRPIHDQGFRHRDDERLRTYEGNRRGSRDDPYRYSQSFGNPQFDEHRGYGAGANVGGDLRDDWQDHSYAWENARTASRNRSAQEFGSAHDSNDFDRNAPRRNPRFERYPDSPQGLSSGEWRDQYRDSGRDAFPRDSARFGNDSAYGWRPLEARHLQDHDRGYPRDRMHEGERYAADVRYGRPDISAPEPRRQTPKGYTRSDTRIEDDICEHLYHANDIDVAEVSVSVKNGTVTLQGSVPERRMKHRIEDICERCIGVSDVENRIRVAAQNDTGASRSDPTANGLGTPIRKEGGNPAAH